MDTISLVSFGLVDRTPVFMDVANDCYFRLGEDQECTFLALLKDMATGPAMHGLVRGSKPEEWEIEAVSLPPVARLTLPSDRGHDNANVLHVLGVAKLLLAVKRALRSHSIKDILESAAGRNSNTPGTPGDLIARAIAYRSARRVVPLHRNCLTDSLALLRWLATGDGGATLVFGVKLDPFAAHCWVQSGDMLLNDRPERVERFSPVRIINCTPAMP